MAHAPEQTSAKPPATKPQPTPGARRWRRVLAAATWIYAVAVVLVAVWMHQRGDRTWLATIFLFGPRWLSALPLAVLVPLAGVWHRRSLIPLALAAGVVVFSILGFEVHPSSATAPYQVRVFTCNVNQLGFSTGELAERISQLNPDIVALQEVPYRPPPIDWPRDWQVVQFDKMIVASRHPVERHEHISRPMQPNKPLAARFLVELPLGEVQFFNLHLTTPRRGLAAVIDRQTGWSFSGVPQLEENLAIRADEARVVRDWIDGFVGPKFVVGDFNMPHESAIYRAQFADLENAYGTAGFGFGFTKLTGRDILPYGTRIDHILYTPPWRCIRAWLAADVGSDHLPLVADFTLSE